VLASTYRLRSRGAVRARRRDGARQESKHNEHVRRTDARCEHSAVVGAQAAIAVVVGDVGRRLDTELLRATRARGRAASRDRTGNRQQSSTACALGIRHCNTTACASIVVVIVDVVVDVVGSVVRRSAVDDQKETIIVASLRTLFSGDDCYGDAGSSNAIVVDNVDGTQTSHDATTAATRASSPCYRFCRRITRNNQQQQQ
jgi:hypothetical protein